MPGVDAELIAQLGGSNGQPAPEARIAEAEKALGVAFPEELRAFYAIANGVRVQRLWLDVVSLDRMLTFRREWTTAWPPELGYLPFARCDNTSDFLCVLGATPLRGRVAFVPHDDGPRLLYPSLRECLEALGQLRGRDLHALPGWYAEHPADRSSEDDDSARDVFQVFLPRLRVAAAAAAANAPRDSWRPDLIVSVHALGLAVTALGARSVELLERALDEDQQIAEPAYRRLVSLKTSDAEGALERFRTERAFFVERLVAGARANGFGVKSIGESDRFDVSIWLEHAGRSVRAPRVDTFYRERHQEDIVERWVELALSIAAPRSR